MRRDLAPRQDEIAKRDFFDAVVVEDALVDAFEPAAQQGDAGALGPLLRAGLGEGSAAGGKVDDGPFAAVGRGVQRGHLQRAVEDVGAQDEARAAPRRRVIDVAVLARAKAAQVDGVERPEAEVERLAGQRQAERAGERLGEKGDHLGGPRAFDAQRFLHQVARACPERDGDAAVAFAGGGVGCVGHGAGVA